METQTVFNQNGDVDIYPCQFEMGQSIVSGSNIASQRGRMVTEDSGRSHFHAYRTGTGPKYETLYETAHGAVKMTRPQFPPSARGRRCIRNEFVYVTFKFPKKYGLALTKSLFLEEADEVMSYLKTRKEEMSWK